MQRLILRNIEHRRSFVIQEGEPAVLGRGEVDVCILDRSVARRHARIFRNQDDGQWYIEDLGAVIGVQVNGCRMRGQSSIHDGDHILIGNVGLAVEIGEET